MNAPVTFSKISKSSGMIFRSISSALNGSGSSAAVEKLLPSAGDRIAICRCWKSSKMPYCDGSHNKHNKEYDDKVGPCIITIPGSGISGEGESINN